MSTGIKISGPKKGAILAGRQVIMDILEATKEREDRTVQLAFQALINVASVHDVSVSNCTISMNAKARTSPSKQ